MDSPFVLVLFGATGDLAKNKLIPALFTLFTKKELPQDFSIFGFSRREMTDEEYREFIKPFVIPSDPPVIPSAVEESQPTRDPSTRSSNLVGMTNENEWQDFMSHLHYQEGMFDEEKGYLELIDKLKACDEKLGACITRIFYLATPPVNYDSILQMIVNTKISECGPSYVPLSGTTEGQARIAIEKPFGKDVATAKALDSTLATIFEERQIFRVDHYLGKETIQNLLVFRFANGIFDPIWNKEYIDHVQITWSEEKGIGNRGNFFDGVGILQDTAQNHLMQLFAAVAMEMPRSFSKEGVRDARSQAIKDIIPIESESISENVVRGQYVGYRDEKNVDPNSSTETFVAMKFFTNSERFRNVPFYIRAGKKLAKSETIISLVFRQTCHILFKEIGCPEDGNVLTIRIQPNEGISLKIIAKTPGSHLALQPTEMHFNYKEQFGTRGSDAYEKVLTDIITGDQMLFNRSDELEASWTFIEKITQGWENSSEEVLPYEVGSTGPEKAKELIEKDGRKWIE